MFRTKMLGLAAGLTLLSTGSALFATPAIAITEFDYKPGSGPGEFIELTNVSSNPVDVTGWSQDDSTDNPGAHPFGEYFASIDENIIQPGESFILTETDAGSFDSYWSLPASVPVYDYGGKDNLSNDESFYIYDQNDNVEDSMSYSSGSAQGDSSNVPLADLGAPLNGENLVLSSVGDSFGSYQGSGGSGDIGNPGIYTPYVAAPEPASLGLLAVVGAVGLLSRRRRRISA